MKYFLIVFALLFSTGCGERDIRAQAGADTMAGIGAAIRANSDGDQAATDAILRGVGLYVPAATGIPPAEWPVSAMSPTEILADPAKYTHDAPPVPTGDWFWAAAGGIGLGALALLRTLGPLIPGGGPLIKMAADAAWGLMATKEQKSSDATAAKLADAAIAIGPVLAVLRDSPPEAIPSSVLRVLSRPEVAAAIHVVTQGRPA